MVPWRSTMLAVLLAMASAGLVRCCAPPFSVPALAFVALVPLLAALDGRRPLDQAGLGWLFGVALNALLAFPWASGAIVSFTGAAPWRASLLVMTLAGWQGLVFFVAISARAGLERLRIPSAVAFGLGLAAAEWLVPLWLPTTLALAIDPSSSVGQLAAIGGSPLVAGAIAAINAVSFDLGKSLCSWRLPRAHGVAGVLSLLAFGEMRRQSTDGPSTSLNVELVQANATTGAPFRAHLAATPRSSTPGAGAPDLVLWAEGATGITYTDEALGALARKVALETGAPTLFGTDVRVHGHTGDGPLFNSAVLADASGVQGRHDKQKLFAIGETAAFTPLAQVGKVLLPKRGREDYAVGTGNDTPLRLSMTSRSLLLQTLVCLEDATPLEHVARDEAGILVGISNDRWFGDSSEPLLHEALARYRAIEGGQPMVRVANTGVSGAYDRHGRVLARSVVGTTWSTTVSVHPTSALTPFLLYGARRFRLLAAFLLFTSALPLVRRLLTPRPAALRQSLSRTRGS